MSMTHQRELDRDRRTADHDHPSPTPGRRDASAELRRPANPIASGIVMRKEAGDELAAHAEDSIASAASGSGHALPGELRERFEGSLGTDLSSVRVHTGGASETAAKSVAARAYTVGNDIHFGAGHFDPASASGQHLLAHEVAHTVQQRGGSPGAPQFKLEVSKAGDALESEADRAADAMVSGSRATVSAAGGGTVQRDTDRNPLTGEPTLPRPLFWDGTVVDGDITGAWAGQPQFTKLAMGNMTQEGLDFVNKVGGMKTAFTAVWNQAQGNWNAAVPAFTEYSQAAQDAENKGLADFGGKGSDIDLDAQTEDFGGKQNVSEAFLPDADKVETGNKTFDKTKVDNDLQREITTQKGNITKAVRALTASERGIDDAKADLDSAKLTVDNAVGALEAKKDAVEQAALQREIDAMKKAAGVVDSAIGSMSKIKGGSLEGVQEAGAGALQMLNTFLWEAAMSKIESQIQVLQGGINQTEITGLDNLKKIAQNNLGKAVRAVRTAIDNYKTKCGEVKDAHGALGKLLEKATVQSGGGAKRGERVRAAVEAIPLMELTLQKVEALKARCITVPENDQATWGGGMAANGQELVNHNGILAGWKTTTSDAATKWQKRLATAKSLVNQA